jgi:hypothetical protein
MDRHTRHNQGQDKSGPQHLLFLVLGQRLLQNIALFLSGPGRPPPPPQFQPLPSATGGLKLAPFPPRKAVLPTPISYMNEEQANELRDAIFTLLDQFDSSVPNRNRLYFTYAHTEIRRLQYNAFVSSACTQNSTTAL